MAYAVTEKNIKINTCINGLNSVEDTKAIISHKKLKALGAKRRIYRNTEEVFFLIETDYELSL